MSESRSLLTPKGMLRAMTPGDWIVCVALAVGSVAYSAASTGDGAARAFAVRVGRDVVLEASLARDARYPIEGRRGTVVVEVSGGAVRVAESDCPGRVCVGMGAKDRPGEWIACVPNAVAVELRGGRADAGAPDAITR